MGVRGLWDGLLLASSWALAVAAWRASPMTFQMLSARPAAQRDPVHRDEGNLHPT